MMGKMNQSDIRQGILEYLEYFSDR